MKYHELTNSSRSIFKHYATAREKFTLKGGIGNDLILGYGNSRPEKLRTDDADNAGQYHSVNLEPNSATDHTSTDWKDINGQWQFDTRIAGGRSALVWYLEYSAYLGSYWTLTGTDPQYGDVSYNNRLYTFAFLPSAETQANDEITEVLIGGAGDDLISGSIDADYMDGGDDNDILIGNYGNDFMFGVQGKTTFSYC